MNITKGKQQKAQRVVVYGPEGIGKSSLAAQFPTPVFIDIESGTTQLDVARADRPSSWAMLLGQVAEFRRDNHGFQTLVVDTADAAERLCIAHVCAVANVSSIEDFGYGKGFTKVGEAWNGLLNELTLVAESAGMHVVMIAHSTMRKFEQPDEFGAYDRFELKLCKQACGPTKEWCDMLLFANYETIVVRDDKTKSVKAAGGQRVIYTEHSAVFDAKNRHGLPSKMQFPKAGAFAAFAACFGMPSPEPVTPRVSAPAATTAPTPRPKQAPAQIAPEPKQQPKQMAATPAAFNARLYDLMQRDGITEAEVQGIVAAKGYFPIDTPIHNYPDAFVDGVLVSCWDKVKGAIIAKR